jgi:hypothetical protein
MRQTQCVPVALRPVMDHAERVSVARLLPRCSPPGGNTTMDVSLDELIPSSDFDLARAPTHPMPARMPGEGRRRVTATWSA